MESRVVGGLIMLTLENAVSAMTRICGPGTIFEQSARCSFTNEVVRNFAVIATSKHLIVTELVLHSASMHSGFRVAIIEMMLTLCRLNDLLPLVVSSLAEADPAFWSARGFAPSPQPEDYWVPVSWHWPLPALQAGANVTPL